MIGTQEFYTEVGCRIRRAREKLGLSQESLARLVSLTRTSVTNIEKGRQKFLVHTLMDLASALQVDAVTLLPQNNSSLETQLDELLKDHSPQKRDWIKDVVVSVEEEENW